MKNNPLISIAIFTYNYGRFISKAIESVLKQEIDDFELIIIDDNSQDNTREVVEKYLPNKKIKYFRNEKNIGVARNWGLANEMATGKYIATLHADDFFYKGHLKKLLNLLENNKSASLAYVPCKWVDTDDKIIKIAEHVGHPKSSSIANRNEFLNLLIYDNFITPSAAVVRSEILKQVEPPDTQLKHAIDWDLWIRIAQINPHFIYDGNPSVAYRIHDSNDTKRWASNIILLLEHIRILEKVLLDERSFKKIKGFEHKVIWLLYNRKSSYSIDLINNETQERIKRITESIFYNNLYTDSNGTAQLFIAAEKGFCEEDSIIIINPKDKDILEFDLSAYRGRIKGLRFDPLDKPVACGIEWIHFVFDDGIHREGIIKSVFANATMECNGIMYFFLNDPVFLFDVPLDILKKITSILIKIKYIDN